MRRLWVFACVLLLWGLAAGRDAVDLWIDGTQMPVMVHETGA